MLQIAWKPDLPAESPDVLLVIAVASDDLEDIDERLGAGVRAALTHAGFQGNAGDRFSMTTLAEGLCQRLLLGCGELDEPADLRRLAFEAGAAARRSGLAGLVLDLRGKTLGEDAARGARLIAEGLELAGYRYTRYLDEDEGKPPRLEQATIVTEGDADAQRRGSARGQVIAEAIAKARDLGNGPAELVTPTFLAETASELAAELRGAGYDVSCEVFDLEECERRAMGLYLAVARGSEEPPKFIHMTYKPKAQTKGRVCLVGKGVTFDSGGYSIKPTDGMLQMKLDMGGAAAVIGAMHGIARRSHSSRSKTSQLTS